MCAITRAILVGCLLVLCGLASADQEITAAGVSVKVKGQSGKMTLTIPKKEDNSTIDVECQMAALRQLDAEGNTLGGGGSEKHSFNSFATQDFTFSTPTTGKYEGLNVTKVSFASTLVGSSELKIVTMIFQESGSFNVGSDTVNVTAGAVKFNVELGDWSWCGGSVECKGADGEGQSVELDISIAAEGLGSLESKNGSSTFDIGGGNELMMLNTYSTDGGSTWVAMPAGYPKVSGSTFTLKFPKWTGSLIYDPIVTSASDNGSDEITAQLDGSPGLALGSGVPLLAAALAWAAA